MVAGLVAIGVLSIGVALFVISEQQLANQGSRSDHDFFLGFFVFFPVGVLLGGVALVAAWPRASAIDRVATVLGLIAVTAPFWGLMFVPFLD
jgi:hypothetical protein